MTEYTEDCCFNYVRDHCQGKGCPCGCHQPRSVLRSKHESDSAYLAWIEDADGGAIDLLRTHVVQAAFRGGWNAARAADPGTMSDG